MADKVIKRRAKGEGSLKKQELKNGKTIWEGKLVVGYNEKGNPVRKSFRGKTQREVIEQMLIRGYLK